MPRTIAGLVTDHAREAPEKCALTDSEFAISYGALELASRRFARRLIELGCQPGDRVVFFTHKEAAIMAGVIGVFKARAIYVPLDPSMPAGRLRFILEDLSPRAIVVRPDLLEIIEENAPADATIISTLEVKSLPNEERPIPESDVLPTPQDDDVAYCIYTSGSTGWPKGVLIRHRSVVDFFEGTKAFYDVDRDSRCVSFSPLHFDGSVIDALFPLSRGAWTYVYSDLNDPDMLFEVIAENRVTHVAAFGAMLDVITLAVDFDDTLLPELETVITGAHAPDVQTVQKWLQKTAGGKVINAYGPTEATCACAAHAIREVEPERREPYPIGRPFKHSRLTLVDEENHVIDEPGVTGELLIGGSQLLKSYWKREEENAARLVEVSGITHYRTGDICKYLPDGNLLFVGRNDSEVNIGGYRVDLNEIKRAIDNVEGVGGSEIVKTESSYGEPILLAAVVLREEGNLRNNGNESRDRAMDLLKGRLQEELPSYMVPRHLIALSEFPLMASGKIDRRALTALLESNLTQRGENENDYFAS